MKLSSESEGQKRESPYRLAARTPTPGPKALSTASPSSPLASKQEGGLCLKRPCCFCPPSSSPFKALELGLSERPFTGFGIG
ncbi:unnamed protein product [Bursaphelenchus okinawaensis]|uniref:Uncharacterized protein n=1 Tax=Bursaphelenchus okinawaensis TaxID=465554 RepID=A0A811LCT9_9BILA|nr:unnamed protein product [Bursaphelenchus okinawaensis]CAG9120424.1 unnamed protein product [Bursaphelenchus okinawaensis]